MDAVPEFHAEVPQAKSVSEGLAHGPYAAARSGVEPMTLRLRVTDSNQSTTHAPQFLL